MTVLGDLLRAIPEGTFADVHESGGAYLVVLDAPGVGEGSVSVGAEDGVIEISAVREREVPAGFEPVRTEREGDVALALPLPPDARPDGVTWTLDRGVLSLTVPKMDGAGSESGDPDPETA